MPRLASSDVLNAPADDVILSIPSGGVFILKQLLAQWVGWDTDDPLETDALDAILSETIRLQEYTPSMSERVFTSVLESDFITVPSGEGLIDMTQIYVNPEYASFSTPNLTLQSGVYAFFITIRVSAFGTGLTGFTHRFRIRPGSTQQFRVWEQFFDGGTQTYSYFCVMPNPPTIYFTWQHFAAQPVGILQAGDSTRFEVIRL